MKIKLANSFVTKLNEQVKYISRDKPLAARKFKIMSLIWSKS